jgi:hypothetical protein
VAAVAVAVLLIGLTAGVTWVANIEPVAKGSVRYNQLVSPGVPDTATERSVEAFGVDGSILSVPAEPGGRFTYRFSITNEGPVPIEIVDAGVYEAELAVNRRVVGMEPDLWDDPGRFDRFVPFRPFTLEPDGEAALEMEVEVHSRIACASWVGWYSEPITFRVLGVERVQGWVDTGVEVRVLPPPDRC